MVRLSILALAILFATASAFYSPEFPVEEIQGAGDTEFLENEIEGAGDKEFLEYEIEGGDEEFPVYDSNSISTEYESLDMDEPIPVPIPVPIPGPIPVPIPVPILIPLPFCCDRNHSLIQGKIRAGARLLKNVTVMVESKQGKIIESLYRFPVNKKHKNKVRLSAIQVIDRSANGTNGCPRIVRGGVGKKKVLISFESLPNYGLDFMVYIYGKGESSDDL